MSNHLSHLLAKWFPNKDKFDWVLATIYKTEGPCYRKSGAMMLFSSQGEQLGMLSGGCLESDISISARKVMQTGQPISLCYDGSDEDDLSFHLGIGCGGTVYIMLQQINNENNYLSLTQVYDALKGRTPGYYYQPLIENNEPTNGITASRHAYFIAEPIADITSSATVVSQANSIRCHSKDKSNANSNDLNSTDKQWLANPIIPEPHLLVVGGGIDARPLVNMAVQLGWQVSLWDPRPANARKEFFSNVNHIIKGDADVLTDFSLEKDVNAAVLMSHNVEIDAQALKALYSANLHYLALLGPENRKKQVIAKASVQQSIDVNIGTSNIINTQTFKFAGPSGLNIGGTLPESIALSILTECHACLYGKNAQSMSLVL